MTQRQDSRESRCNQAKTWNRVEKRERDLKRKTGYSPSFYGDKKGGGEGRGKNRGRRADAR